MTRSLKSSLLFFLTKFHELLSDFPNYETIFTAGSKDGDTAGSACGTPSDTYKCRIPDNASSFSAEIKAIDLALDHIEQSRNTEFTVPRRLFCFGSLVILDVARCYLWLFKLYINIKIGKNS